MFDKLIKIQEQKIDDLQSKLFNINKEIDIAKQKMVNLRNSIDFDPPSSQIGSFLAISIHHQAIKENMKLQEEAILEKTKESMEIKKALQKENLELEKYKHILEVEAKERQDRIKRKEALELDEFLQKASI